jgi:serine/threonine-protein kinase RsbW
MISRDIIVYSNYESLRGASEEVRAFLKEAGTSDDEIGLCELAVQELLANLVEHAYRGEASNPIKLKLRREGNMFYVETEDNGQKVNLDLGSINMPDPASLQVGGYGLAIIKNLMDKVDYQRINGINIWRIEKKLGI